MTRGQISQHHPGTGRTRGPTPKSRTRPDLYVCQINDVPLRHPLHVEAERSRASGGRSGARRRQHRPQGRTPRSRLLDRDSSIEEWKRAPSRHATCGSCCTAGTCWAVVTAKSKPLVCRPGGCTAPLLAPGGGRRPARRLVGHGDTGRLPARARPGRLPSGVRGPDRVGGGRDAPLRRDPFLDPP